MKLRRAKEEALERNERMQSLKVKQVDVKVSQRQLNDKQSSAHARRVACVKGRCNLVVKGTGSKERVVRTRNAHKVVAGAPVKAKQKRNLVAKGTGGKQRIVRNRNCEPIHRKFRAEMPAEEKQKRKPVMQGTVSSTVSKKKSVKSSTTGLSDSALRMRRLKETLRKRKQRQKTKENPVALALYHAKEKARRQRRKESGSIKPISQLKPRK